MGEGTKGGRQKGGTDGWKQGENEQQILLHIPPCRTLWPLPFTLRIQSQLRILAYTALHNLDPVTLTPHTVSPSSPKVRAPATQPFFSSSLTECAPVEGLVSIP